MLAQHLLGQGFVERDGQRGRVRSGVGDAHQLAQGGHRGLAVAALDSLGDVEDQIHRRVRELAGQLGGGLDGQHHVAVALERLADGLDGFGGVVLGLGVISALGVDALHVVGEPDAQRLGSPPAATNLRDG